MQGCKAKWHVAMRPGKRKALNPQRELDQLLDKVESLKASVRAKVEHPFRVIKQQFGYAKVRYRGLTTARLDGVALTTIAEMVYVVAAIRPAGASAPRASAAPLLKTLGSAAATAVLRAQGPVGN